jgi:hypothetical protein
LRWFFSPSCRATGSHWFALIISLTGRATRYYWNSFNLLLTFRKWLLICLNSCNIRSRCFIAFSAILTSWKVLSFLFKEFTWRKFTLTWFWPPVNSTNTRIRWQFRENTNKNFHDWLFFFTHSRWWDSWLSSRNIWRLRCELVCLIIVPRVTHWRPETCPDHKFHCYCFNTAVEVFRADFFNDFKFYNVF